MFLIDHPILYTITLFTVCLTVVLIVLIIKGGSGPNDSNRK